MDVDGIVAKQLKQMEKEMREKETKLRTQEKKVSPPVFTYPLTHLPTHSPTCNCSLHVLWLLYPG